MKAFMLGFLPWLFECMLAAGAYVCYTVMWESARANDPLFFALGFVCEIVVLVGLMTVLTIVGQQLSGPEGPKTELKDGRESAETIAGGG